MTNFRINPNRPVNNIVTNISSGFNSYVEVDPQSINTLATLNYGNKILHDKDKLSGSAREFSYPTGRSHIASSLQNKRLLDIPNRSISAYTPTLNQSRNVRIALAPDAIRQNKFDFSSNVFDLGYPKVQNYNWCGEKLSSVWNNGGGRVGGFAFYAKAADTTGMNLNSNHLQPLLQYPYKTRSAFVVGNRNGPNCFCNVINLSGTYVFDWTLEYGLRLKSSNNTFVDTGDMTLQSGPDYFDIKLYSNVNASYIWIRFRPPVRWRYYYNDWTLNEDFSILEDSTTEFVRVVNCCGDGIVVPPDPPLLSALTPTFGATTRTADGFTVQIINYNSAYTWAGTATASGSVVIEVLIIDDFLNNTSTTEGYVRVTGVAPGTNSTATITTSRAGYSVGLATVTQASLFFDMSMVTVGNPGNAVDTNPYYAGSLLASCGDVSYSYQIGTYEVTGYQYTKFLNAVASTDTYSLYNASMGTDDGYGVAQISRSGTSGTYAYTVMNSTGSRPITWVSWFNCARFCNWMSNGQPNGEQTSTTTENGAYNVNGVITGNAVAANTTNPNTNLAPTYRMPTENEWYKAAYYSPNYGGTGVGGYYRYATQSDSSPGTTIGSSANQANYGSIIGHATDVGSFSGSESYYGTFDQSGNVREWNDLNNTPSSARGVRGGSWINSSTYISPAGRDLFGNPEIRYYIGFRLAR